MEGVLGIWDLIDSFMNEITQPKVQVDDRKTEQQKAYDRMTKYLLTPDPILLCRLGE